MASRPEMLGKLPQLQNLVKRDPEAYKSEFLLQFRHFESELELLRLSPASLAPAALSNFANLTTFLSHVASCYPDEMANFPTELMNVLDQQGDLLPFDIRKNLVQNLILLRNRELIDPITLLPFFFKLFRLPDKRIRELVHAHIVSDLKRLNAKSQNQRVNRVIQNFLFNMIRDEEEQSAVRSLQVVVELFKKKIWHDQKTVNVLAAASTQSLQDNSAKNSKLMVLALHFFLGIDADIDEEDKSFKAQKKSLVEVDYHAHSKKTKKRERETRAQIAKNRRSRRREVETTPVFPAIELLNDPQGMCEKMLQVLRKTTHKFETKLLILNFVSRVIGTHKLVVLQIYSVLQRYLQSPSQEHVTQILAYLLQACHDLVPPEDIAPIVRTIAHNFVTERNNSEVVAVGINSLRGIFTRVPLVLEVEEVQGLVEDLVQYNRAKDKSIVMAARGVLNLIREIYPSLLKRKERGKFHDMESKPKGYGEVDVKDGVDGVELLMEAEASGRFDDEDGDGWEVASEDSDDGSEDWVDVSSDEEEKPEDDGQEGEEGEQEEQEEEKKIDVKDRMDAKRILTPRDFERIAMLKQEQEELRRDPKNRNTQHTQRNRKRKTEDSQGKHVESKVEPDDLAGFVKKRRMTQEERLRSVLQGREEFEHKKSGGGTTEREKQRKKHFQMVQKSRRVQAKVALGAKQVQKKRTQAVKKAVKDGKKPKRRRT